jgi:hypothetical protein
MQTKRNSKEIGNVLSCVLATILIVSLIGAIVLRNSTTRLNASTNHVRAWKEALSAAETGGDIAFAEIRKQISDPLNQWAVADWDNSGKMPPYIQTDPTHDSGYKTFGSSSNLRTRTVVQECYFDPITKLLTPVVWPSPTPPGHLPTGGNRWYRVRSKGTAPLPGFRRVGMDDALSNDGQQHFAQFGSSTAVMQDITARGKGDSLLRKIDFQYDHFVATYGPTGNGVGKTQAPAPFAPSISRRIEQIISPVTPFFDAAIRCSGSFYGLGAAAWIDSYSSYNGPYDPAVKTNPASPYYSDSRHGNVEIGSASATIKGTIYGDVATNGGHITASPSITGTIDNNVPFTLEDYVMPDYSAWAYQLPGNGPGQLPSAVTGTQALIPPVRAAPSPAGGTTATPTYYVISSLSGALTVNPTVDPISGNPVETYVAIRVTGDMSGGNAGITINPKVHLRIYFERNISLKNNNIVNQNPSFTNPYAGNLQFYGISPPRDPVTHIPMWTQTIDLNSGTPQTLAATFYAPSAVVNENGNPDFIGTMVCKSFNSNGNIGWHYDRALNDDGELLDFRVASYIEDTR